jgi:glycerol-3-phosphate acyltransferase PlsY
MGSKNPGATNVLRTGNKYAAVFTLLGDMLKATLVVGIALSLNFSGNFLTAVILAVLLGHMYPIFYNFKGGKGVATALGILLAINWELALFTLLIWIIIFFISKYSSLSAIIAAIASPLIAYTLNQDQHIIIISVVLAILILLRHKRNIQNLINGTESSFKSN